MDSDLPANDDINCGNPTSLPLPSVGESSAPHSASLPLLDTCNDLEEQDMVSSSEGAIECHWFASEAKMGCKTCCC
jgi:hypothetical protein